MVILKLIIDNLIFICERNKEEPIQKEISDLIYFQGQPNKPSLPEYNNGEFINYYQNIFSTNLINKKNYIVIFKIKDIILKCYPMLLPAYKSGLSMRKIFKKYDLNNLPSFDKSNFYLLKKMRVEVYLLIQVLGGNQYLVRNHKKILV